MIYIGIV